MPDFQTVSGGAAWSDLAGRNTSERVATGANVRPEAEVKLRGRKIEIRTGARVTRARGAWTSFKRGVTKVRSGLWMLGKDQRQTRALRHAEYRFDRHVNRLVEDLANKGNLTLDDISRRLKQLNAEGDLIRRHDPSVDNDSRLAARFEKNLNEALDAIARTRPEALGPLLNAFRKGGPMHDLRVGYTIHNDPATQRLIKADAGDRHGLRPKDYVNAGIADAPPQTIQDAITHLEHVPQRLPLLAGRAARNELQAIVARHVPDNHLHGVVDDLGDSLPLLDQRAKDYVARHLEAYVAGQAKNQQDLGRDALRNELRLALAGVQVGLPEKLAQADSLSPSRASPPFPVGMGLALASGQRDRQTEIGALHRHLGAVGGDWKSERTGQSGPYDESTLHRLLNRVANADPSDRKDYEEHLGNALNAVKHQLWRSPKGPESGTLRRLHAELVIALSQVRLQGLASHGRMQQGRFNDANYRSPLYDAQAVRQLVSRDRIGAHNQTPNPFKGMPVSDFWKMFVDREYQDKTGPSDNRRLYEGVFDRGHDAEPGFMRGMVEAMDQEVCGKLGQRMTADDIERMHDRAVGHEDEDKMLRGLRHKMIASYGVNKHSKDGLAALKKRLAGHVGPPLAKSEKNMLSKLNDDQKLDELRKMNRQEQTDNKPDGMQTWGFMGYKGGDPHGYFWPKEHAQSKQITDETLDAYYREIGNAGNDRDKLRAIVKCCQTLHQLHVFRDGNARTMGMLLLNRLLMEQGMSPAILEDPKAFKGLSPDELIDEIEQGQLLFKIVRSGADMRPPDDMSNFQ